MVEAPGKDLCYRGQRERVPKRRTYVVRLSPRESIRVEEARERLSEAQGARDLGILKERDGR
jgi:hypothetical protein